MLLSQAQNIINQKALIIWCLICLGAVTSQEAPKSEIIDVTVPANLLECATAALVCKATPTDVVIWWSHNGRNVSSDARYVSNVTKEVDIAVATLTIQCVAVDDIGNYTCHVGQDVSQTRFFDILVVPEVMGGPDVYVPSSNKSSLHCIVKGHPIEDIKWSFENKELDSGRVDQEQINTTLIHSHLNFQRVSRSDNGTYICEVKSPTGSYSAVTSLFVKDKPEIIFDVVKGVGMNEIFMNWTVNYHNTPIDAYYIQLMEKSTGSWVYTKNPTANTNNSFIIDDLKPNTGYKIKITAKNEFGMNFTEYGDFVETLSKDPEFVPEISVKGVTQNSISIGWSSPPPEIQSFVHVYQLKMIHENTKMQAVQSANYMKIFLFEGLHPASVYKFQVAACSEFTNKCGNWSLEVEGTTMDGVSSAPENTSIQCKFDNISRTNFVFAAWDRPQAPNGLIVRYKVRLEGDAAYKNEKGAVQNVTWGPKERSVSNDSYSAHFDSIPFNTNYTLKVMAFTRSRSSGKEAEVHCSSPPTVPDKERMSRFNWVKVEEQGRWMFKLSLPRIPERNGPICCYRVVLVQLEAHQQLADLPAPEELPLSSYDEVSQRKGGAYVAEVFQSDALLNEVFLGDGVVINSDQNHCSRCLHAKPPAANHSASLVSDLMAVHVQDGLFNFDSNYTGFVQVIVFGKENEYLQTLSNYLVTLKAGPSVMVANETSQVLMIVVQVLLGLLAVVALLLLALCLLHRYSKQVAEAQGVEMTLRNSFRHIFCNKGYTEVEMSVMCGRHLCQSLRGGTRHVPVAPSPPDMLPILREDMLAAFAERHRDSDYGFQCEFEQLPDKFADRTTRASDARENMHKNRYPDIKAYDQTRVKLSAVEGVQGSDYINANFVVGYKERKKFICAQGPMENTVSDFWRMIWEQNLELVLMLTNLEEYSKTKCAKYWPDQGEKSYGDISVAHVKEKRISDYCIRELRIWRLNADKEKEGERSIVQYHFLVWKDFAAPEHPSGILKFIKRMNEAYSLEKGPILVHCSAGVGRTGTLVALDSMAQQLQEEGEISVFNTICDLRHQRNFLVQNMKQYIFVYKALVELAQFGDTEYAISKLKGALEKLKQRENGKDKSKLEEEFEKFSKLHDEPKPYTIASGEENRTKNRCESILPYDRNRVILAPVPGREHSTYINASFLEGYDNSESLIVTQDPMEATVADFWRMVSEHCISTLVMLSDLGEGAKKCPRYWPDDEVSHNHIKVKYIQSESCPYYTKREFSVTNCKMDESITVTQLQYNGWPTVEGEVPEVTRGLIELVDQTHAHQDSLEANLKWPLLVHCNQGAERSFIFVALTTLIKQIRTEKRVDIFNVCKKLRSQRQGMLQNFAQYEFLYRALVNYIDLHHLCDQDL